MAPEIRKTLRWCLITVLGMAVAVPYGLVPLYDVLCEAAGINGKTGIVRAEDFARLDNPVARTVTVQFDANVNSALPWEFKPVQFQMQVTPGQMYQTEYVARNLASVDVTGQAVPSVAPGEASRYFNKTECFCFSQQLLQPQEEKVMPVRFIVDADLPADIETLILSYTFFKMGEAEAVGNATHAGNETAANNRQLEKRG